MVSHHSQPIDGEACHCGAANLIELRLRATDLGAVRFALDPIWETVASLRLLARPGRSRLRRELLGRITAQASALDLEMLLAMVSQPSWSPVMLAPPLPESRDRRTDPVTRLGMIADTDPEVVRRDRARMRAMGFRARSSWDMPARALAMTVAESLVRYWQAVLAPSWPAVTAITEADLATRSRAVTTDGLAPSLPRIDSRLSLHRGALRLGAPGHHWHRQYSGDGVWMVPSVFLARTIAEIEVTPPVICYPALGADALWRTADGPGRTRSAATPDPLRPAVGRTRSRLLHLLHRPSTTTVLAGRLGLSPGTVSEHLRGLVGAGLLQSERHGRQVFYRLTPIAASLVNDTGQVRPAADDDGDPLGG